VCDIKKCTCVILTIYRYLTMVRGCNLIAGDEDALTSDSAFHVSHISPSTQSMPN
jgi:hypothetical protein